MIRVMLIHCLNIILFINTGNVMKPTREIVKKTHFHTMTTIAVLTRKKAGLTVYAPVGTKFWYQFAAQSQMTEIRVACLAILSL